MGKYSLGKAVTPINAKMNQDEAYLKQSKSDEIVRDIETQYKAIAKSFENCSTYITSAVSNKIVKGDYARVLKGWAKRCASQANNATSRRTKMETQYKADVAEIAAKLLNARIVELESLVNKLSEDNTAQAAQINNLQQQMEQSQVQSQQTV